MAINRPEIHKSDVASSLWRKYERTEEYKKYRRTESISSVHPLVKSAESFGLTKVIQKFIGELVSESSLREKYESRDAYEWLEEWKEMHKLLFQTVFKARGEFRRLGHDVRFGSPGDEDLHKIPAGGGQTITELYGLAKTISQDLSFVDPADIDQVCEFLARIHYGFIRIHPFGDGNGRIARAITDQLAISLGYPPVIAGFPRLNKPKKDHYHDAITRCIGDPSCNTMKTWILIQVTSKIDEIA